MSKKFELLILIIALLSILLLFFMTNNTFFKKDSKLDDINNTEINNIDKSILQKSDIIGIYKVKDDKKSILDLKENGEYELHINMCEGYLKVTGNYEIVDKKLKLLNDTDFENYPSLKENYEFSFTVIDSDAIRLDEDLICLFQNTLFER